ncbi:MAG: hypothetical protein Q9182_006329 [Xanthomendoza sp. 2 TL-2023]
MLFEMLLIIVLLAIFAGYLIRAVKKNALVRKFGCQPLRCPETNYLDGIRAFKELLKALADQRVLLKFGQSMDAVGKNPHTVRRKIPCIPHIMTRDPENIKTIVYTQSSQWELDYFRSTVMKLHPGQGLLTAEGQAWKDSRSFVRQQFFQESVCSLGLFHRHAQELARSFDVGKDGWSPSVDVLPLFLNMTLDIITELLLGQSVSSQNPNTRPQLGEHGDILAQDIKAFGESQDAAAHWIYKAGYLGRFYRILPQKPFKAHRARLQRVVDWYSSKAIKAQSEKEFGKPHRFVLLDEMAERTSDRCILRNETMNLITAGRATSAATFGWLFYYLARYPTVYGRLRSAILEKFGASMDPAHIDASSLRTCKYLQYCFEEALRLGSPVPMIVRKAAQDTTLPKGGGADGEAPIFVAKGTKVIANLFLSHRRQDIWGSDAEEFRPERWEHREHSWDFIPFGGGPRVCIGQQLVRMQLAYIVVFLIQRYDRLEPTDGDCRLRYDTTTNNRPGNGVHVKLHRAVLA